jgi:SAM-dependent methyltransferase
MMTAPNTRNGCRLCGSALSGPRLEMGALPASNRFLTRSGPWDLHPLVVAECRACGLVQLAIHPPAAFVLPRVPWIRYGEPDGHLDDLVDRILPTLSPATTRAFGVAPFDLPLLQRLERRGITAVQLDLLSNTPDEAPAASYPYLETLQARLRPGVLSAIGRQRGAADLVVCRYLLEHCHDPVTALLGLRHLVRPGGSVLIEVPDSTKFLSRNDYSFIWEEHISYFTESTLIKMAVHAGFEVASVSRYEGPLEDALVACLRPLVTGTCASAVGAQTAGLFAHYCDSFVSVRRAYLARLNTIRASGEKVALFGIGHQAVMFANALGLQQHISIVADDDPNKLGWFAPSSLTPIVGSDAILADETVKVCLLAVNPRVEAKIRGRFSRFVDRGGRFYSIFPGNKTATLAEHRQ